MTQNVLTFTLWAYHSKEAGCESNQGRSESFVALLYKRDIYRLYNHYTSTYTLSQLFDVKFDVCLDDKKYMDFFSRTKELVPQKTASTLRGFIESLGMNYETYYSGRRNGNLPRADDAVKIAKALNVSVEYLVTGQHPYNRELEQYKAKVRSFLEELT